ncbi:hypothetical protein HMI55_003055, partial [Coelomomyces lativittatus]
KAPKYITKAFCIQVVHAICGFIFFWVILAGLLMNNETKNIKLSKLFIGGHSFELKIQFIIYTFVTVYPTVWILSYQQMDNVKSQFHH